MANRQETHQSWTTAATFAEAGEWETARSFMPPTRRSRLAIWLEKTAMAITFAEAGLPAEALRYAAPTPAPMPAATRNFLELCGLDQAHLTYGVISPLTLGVKI